MLRNKKGVVTPTAGTDIAALVLLIGLFIVAYVLLLPPADRDQLLKENPNYRDGNGSYGEYGPINGISLLSAIPGELHPFERNTIKRDFPPAILFTRAESSTLNLATALEVKKSPFSEQTKTYTFSADRLEDITGAKLYFFIEEGDGTFYIELNGQTIFEQEIGSNDIPIDIPANALRANNNLKMGVRGSLWEGYKLKNVYIKFDKNYANTIVRRSFELSPNERNGVESAKLSYYLNCIKIAQNGYLTILLNDRILKSDFVVCDVGKQTIDLPREKLRTGTNNLEFRIDQGDYELNDLTLEVKTGQASYPTYNFEVDDDYYFDINTDCFASCRDNCYDDCGSDNDCFDVCLDDCDAECSRGEVVLEIRFVNDEDNRRKKGSITINDNQINFNTDDTLYTRDITDTIRRGDNVLKIIPQSDMEIADLRVVLIR